MTVEPDPDHPMADIEARLRHDLPLAADVLLDGTGPSAAVTGHRRPRSGLAAVAVAAAVVLVGAGIVAVRHDGRHDQIVHTTEPTTVLHPLPTTLPATTVPPADRCPIAPFRVGSATAIAPFGLIGTAVSRSGSYRDLGIGQSAVVAVTGRDGRATSSGGRLGQVLLVRGVPDNDFAISLYAHGPVPLRSVSVLGVTATLYPSGDLVSPGASPTDTWNRVVFGAGADRVGNPCSRWELRADGLTDDQLSGYAAALTLVAPAGSSSQVPTTTTTVPTTATSTPAELAALQPSLHTFASALLADAHTGVANFSPIVDDPSVGVIAAISFNVRSTGTRPRVAIVLHTPTACCSASPAKQGWTVLAYATLDVGGTVVPGSTSITVAHLTGATADDFVVTVSYNAGLATAVVTNFGLPENLWSPVDFVVGRGASHDEVIGATVAPDSITDTENTCVPHCSAGVIVHHTYRYDPARQEMVAPT